MITLLLISLFAIVSTIFYLYVNQAYKYWERKGVYHEKPHFFVGCLKDFTLARKSNTTVFKEIYDRNKSRPFVGIYMGTKPALLLRDAETIKLVLSKDYASFTSRGFPFSPKDVLADNVVFMGGQRWKLIRQKLTPAFTSGRLRKMVPLLAECGKNLQNYIVQTMAENKAIKVRTTIADYTTSVIASCAFGIESKTLSNEYTPFREVGRNFFEQKLRLNFIITLENAAPWIFKYIKFSRFRAADNLFVNIFKNVLRQREESKSIRNDFIDICLDLKEEDILRDPSVGDFSIKITDELLAAQAFFFFLAGHETSESTITYTMYELAHHPDYLKKVHEEVDQLYAKHGHLTSEFLEDAVYLHKVVQETLRKYPPIGNLHRQLTAEEYKFADHNLTIDSGVLCVVPIFALHRDPKNFPHPLKYDPERFANDSEEMDFYYPFGLGPRQCLGIRLAYLQVKAGLISIFKDFTVAGTAPYENDLKMQPVFLAVKPVKLDVKIVKRNI